MNFFQFLIDVFFGCKHKKHQIPQNKQQLKNETTMKNLIENITKKMQDLNVQLNLFYGGNKSAGKRARKATLELEKLFKEFRKRSVNETPGKE